MIETNIIKQNKQTQETKKGTTYDQSHCKQKAQNICCKDCFEIAFRAIEVEERAEQSWSNSVETP